MCIPHADVTPPAPVAVPSLQSASGLDIGGAPRGAAQLGRLKLRLDGGNSAQAPTPAASPLADALALPSAGGTSSTQSATSSADPASYASGSFQIAPNRGLRLPSA